MKRWLIGLLAVLVLTGCSQQPDSTTADTTPTPTAPPTGLYEPNSRLEVQTGGAVKCFPLGTDGCLSVQPMGQNMLTVCLGANGAIELTVLTGDSGIVLASVLLDGIAADSVLASDDRTACYSITENCVVILDSAMHVIDRIFLPDGIQGEILIDETLSTVYFCTEGQIRAMDLTTETPRLLHQHEYIHQQLHSVMMNGQVLVCQIEDAEGTYFEFIDTQSGQTLGKDSTCFQIDSWQDRFFLRRFDSSIEENLFGTAQSTLQQLDVHTQTLWGTPSLSGAVSVTDDVFGLELSFYHLDSGLRKTVVAIPDCHAIYSLCAQASTGTIWFLYEDSDLSQDVLCCWDISLLSCPDETVYTAPRYTAENPDTEGLALCVQRAEALNTAYGIRIVFDGSVKQSDDYKLTPEFQVSLLNAGLDALETCLASLPEGFVKELSGISDAPLDIALVRSMQNVSGQAPAGGTGLQYWAGGDACIALCITDQIQQDFYHQLFHVLEVYLFSESTALDLWDKLNPKGFDYDYNYYDYAAHANSEYLTNKRAFIDAFSMTFAREDRARVFEYAMMEGNEELFASETMQKKLYQLCYCIRDAYGLRKSELTYPWEQYLQQSLAYTKRK